SNQNWSRFSAMMVANSILLGVAGQFVVENKPGLPWLWFLAFPVVGLALCYLWAAAVSRGLQYQDYYVRAARSIEQTHLSPTITVVSEGQNQAESRMGGFGQLRTRSTMRWVIVVFVVLHIAVAGLVLYRFIRSLDAPHRVIQLNGLGDGNDLTVIGLFL